MAGGAGDLVVNYRKAHSKPIGKYDQIDLELTPRVYGGYIYIYTIYTMYIHTCTYICRLDRFLPNLKLGKAFL